MGFRRASLSVIRILSLLLLLFAVAAGPSPVRAEEETPLTIGIFPYLSTRTLLAVWQPLQRYLENRLGRRVVVVTAPDMRSFVERTLSGTYPLVVTAPHFARLAQREAGYRPLLRAEPDLVGVFLVAEDSPARSLADLRGKILATPDSLALITRLALETLRSQNLEPGRDLSLQEVPSHNAAVLAVKQGAVAAAVVSQTAFQQLPAEQRAGLRPLARTASAPHVMILARRDLPPREAERYANLIQTFVQQTPEGRQFLESLGYLGLRPPTEGELRSLDPYVEGLLRTLAAGR